ncbi:MAG: class I SAM-dependent methyltransferase [Gammaproteobacteria bacterium]|nr:class I SAM-dependent methyltransferase [Gammaproteobacteria bacterium]
MSDRKTHWENIYKNKSPLEVGWYLAKPVLSLQLIANSQVAMDAPIIDVGGGASVLVDYLLDEGYANISVLDISANALACVKIRLGDRADVVEWYEDDVISFNPPHQFSIWHDRAVFHFLLDENDRRGYVDALKSALIPKGHVIIAAFAVGGPTQCSGLDIVQYDAKKLQAELGEDFELIEERGELHITPANKEQEFTYFHFVRK